MFIQLCCISGLVCSAKREGGGGSGNPPTSSAAHEHKHVHNMYMHITIHECVGVLCVHIHCMVHVHGVHVPCGRHCMGLRLPSEVGTLVLSSSLTTTLEGRMLSLSVVWRLLYRCKYNMYM